MHVHVNYYGKNKNKKKTCKEQTKKSAMVFSNFPPNNYYVDYIS